MAASAAEFGESKQWYEAETAASTPPDSGTGSNEFDFRRLNKAEIAVQNPDLAGMTIQELDAQLPEQMLLVMVGGEENAHLPASGETVEHGQHVTVIGSRDGVRKAMGYLSGEKVAPTENEMTEQHQDRQ